MELCTAQFITLFLLLIGTFISGCLPILCFRYSKCFSTSSAERGSNKVSSFLIYLGGGVLLATSLLHLLPEAREAFENSAHHARGTPANPAENEENSEAVLPTGNSSLLKEVAETHNEGFALPEFIVLCGFFATYFVEELIHCLLVQFQNYRGTEVRARFCSCAQRDTECSRPFKDVKPDQSLFGAEKKKRRTQQQQQQLQISVEQQRTTQPPRANLPELGESPPILLQSSIISQPFPNYGAIAVAGIPDPAHATANTSAIHQNIMTPPQLVPVPEILTPNITDATISAPISVATLLTVVALSFHSIFEGFAIGFQQSVIGTWTVFFAIAMHKFVIAFVIGVEVMAEENKASLVLSYMAVFSSMSPVGMGIAMSMNGSVAMSNTIVGTVNALATGTLLYVTFYEILQRSKTGICGLHRFVATTLGVGIMAVLQYVVTML